MDTNTNTTSTEGSFDLARTYYCTRCQRDVSNPCIHDAEAIRRKCIPDPNKGKPLSGRKEFHSLSPNKSRFSWRLLLNYLLSILKYLNVFTVVVKRFSV